jgi:hypothetical protein
MAKQGGMGDNLYVGGYELGGDVMSIQRVAGGPAPWDATDITLSAVARLGLARDGGIDATMFFDKATGKAHPRLSLLPSADAIVTYCRSTVLGAPAAALVSKQINYDPTRGQDGSLTFVVQSQANGYGLEWGSQLTAGTRADTTATNGSSVDLGSASPGAFGLQLYVHLTAFTGTSVTIKVQESSDNAVGDAFADVVGATTGALTTIGAVRVATGAIAVERYLRVVTTGTFTVANFQVMATRNPIAVAF